MASQGMQRESVAAWLRENHGDELRAMTRVASPVSGTIGTNVSSSVVNTAISPAWDVFNRSGRSRDDVFPTLMGTPGLFVVSPGTFRVIQLGGWKERPKRTLFETSLDGLVVNHCDADGKTGIRFRCWIVDLPDGRFIVDSSALERKGKPTPYAAHADEFVSVLGNRARAITP